MTDTGQAADPVPPADPGNCTEDHRCEPRSSNRSVLSGEFGPEQDNRSGWQGV
ncbi:hypothetical protein [Streptomyces sp. NPDC048436]|uniref:hypothetical protein n=1 Tax=Streptomyces sp. NPDC048436 TaxID=3365550 RepID=UPI003714F556